MSRNLRIGMSFRALANIEQAFVSYLNNTQGRCFKFKNICTTDYAFAYGMSDEEYEFELNKFLECEMHKINPLKGSVGAIASLSKKFSDFFVITYLDEMHQERIKTWLYGRFHKWTPEVLHAKKINGERESDYDLYKDDLCFIFKLDVFVTEHPFDAEVISINNSEIKVLTLELPWTPTRKVEFASEYNNWNEVSTEINAKAKN